MTARLFHLAFLLAFTGCLETAANIDVGAIPPVVINCHSAQSAFCIPAKAGAKVFVGLTSNSVSCGAYLTDQPVNEGLTQIFDVVGFAPVTVQGPFLVGTINMWHGLGGAQKFDLPRQTYTACGFIDLNGDERWQAQEPIGTGMVDAGGEESLIDNWN